MIVVVVVVVVVRVMVTNSSDLLTVTVSDVAGSDVTRARFTTTPVLCAVGLGEACAPGVSNVRILAGWGHD